MPITIQSSMQFNTAEIIWALRLIAVKSHQTACAIEFIGAEAVVKTKVRVTISDPSHTSP